MKPLHHVPSIITAFVLTSLFMTACGNSPEKSAAGTAATPAEMPDEALPRDFYKRLEGTIANQPVVMHLQCYNGSLHGSYYYTRQGKLIGLSGNVDSLHPGNFQLKEYSDDTESDRYPSLDCVYEKGRLKGSWRSADGKANYVIDLKEAYPQGSLKFAAMSLNREVKADPAAAKSPVATVNKGLLIPEDDEAGNAWLSAQIVKMINGDTVANSSSIAAAARESNALFVKNYEQDLKDAKNDGFDISERFGYDDMMELSVLYNENGLLALGNNFYSYTGGAHGYGGDAYFCFDMQDKKPLKLYDILSADSAQLQPIVEAAFRRQQHLRPTDSLNELLFENHLAVTKNFYFTPTGIGFNYLPYEVAAYAAGSIFVFVPYADLKHYIRPWFAKRMHLD